MRDCALTTWSRISELWEDFRASADEFAKGGSSERKVVNQAYSALTPIMARINADMARRLSATSSGSSAISSGAKAATTITINAPLTINMDERIDRQTFRRDIMPEWLAQMETGLDDARERLLSIVRGSVTAPAEA
jgi:hypothetical protein